MEQTPIHQPADASPTESPTLPALQKLRGADRRLGAAWLDAAWTGAALLTLGLLGATGVLAGGWRILAWAGALATLLGLRRLNAAAWTRRATRGDPCDGPARLDGALAVAAALAWGLLATTLGSHSAAAAASVLTLQGFALGLALPALAPAPLLGLACVATGAAAALACGLLGGAPAMQLLATAAGGLVLLVLQTAVSRWHARALAERAAELEGADRLRDELDAATLLLRRLRADAADRAEVEAGLHAAREAAEQAARAKADFLASMSHEIRTPLNGVLGMAELMLGTDLNRRQRHFARAIHRSGEALMGIINDILDFSKIEAGKLSLRVVPLDVRQLVEEVGLAFADRAERAHVNLICAFSPTDHAVYRGDPDRLRQILTNLVGNALKFTEQGEVSVHAHVAGQAKRHAVLRFEVRDTGIGIDPAQQAGIFESFAQVEGGPARAVGGTGLGLAICKRLVALMDGEIGVESTPGKGSLFWFTCPLEREDAARLGKPALPPGLLGGKRVLIADPIETNRQLLAAQCTAWGMVVELGGQEQETVQRLERAAAAGTPFDVLLFDRRLSRDGLQFAWSLQRHPQLRELALVMMVSVGNLEDTGQWLNSGIGGIVNKPVRQLELYEGLVDALGLAPRETARAAAPARPALRLGGHVLLAEDNPVNEELARAMLENLGCRVSVVHNGREAVAAVAASLMERREHYDLVLMDCQMPELDGYAASRAIREAERVNGRRMPIIAVTASALDGDREKCLAAGMDDYLAKPYTLQTLEQMLAKWLPLAATAPAAVPAAPTTPAALVRDITAPGSAAPRPQPAPPAGGEALSRLARLYLDNAPRLLDAVHAALERGDRNTLQRAAQTLQSTSASVGAHAVAELCRTLVAPDTGDDPSVTLSILDFEFERACADLHAGLSPSTRAPRA